MGKKEQAPALAIFVQGSLWVWSATSRGRPPGGGLALAVLSTWSLGCFGRSLTEEKFSTETFHFMKHPDTRQAEAQNALGLSRVSSGSWPPDRLSLRRPTRRARAAPAAAARRTLVAQKSGSSLLPAWMKELRETHQRQHSTRSAAGPPPGLTRSRWAALRTAPAVLPAVDPSSSSHLRRTGSTGEELARSSLPASTQSRTRV